MSKSHRSPHVVAFLAAAAAAAAPLLAAAPHARAGSDMYDLSVTDAKTAPGAKGKTSVLITGKNGWHVNEEAPISMKLAPVPGLTLDKEKLSKADLAERTKDKARFDVGFTAGEPGRKTIDAEAKFVMCQAEACKPVTEKLVLAVDVAAAAPAAKSPKKSSK